MRLLGGEGLGQKLTGLCCWPALGDTRTHAIWATSRSSSEESLAMLPSPGLCRRLPLLPPNSRGTLAPPGILCPSLKGAAAPTGLAGARGWAGKGHRGPAIPGADHHAGVCVSATTHHSQLATADSLRSTHPANSSEDKSDTSIKERVEENRARKDAKGGTN